MITIPEAAITALLGYAVVFMGLIALMIVVTIVGKVMAPKKAAAPKAAPAPKKQQNSLADKPAPVAAPAAAAAPGTAGQVKLYDTPDRDAAMIMAIVANKLNKPLNELRFISIKEVK